jgi:VIT1/CCC1 family predicted Fe2+/Mn2+ transporter
MAEHSLDHEPIDYSRGTMDIREQASTFNAFMGLTKWAALFVAALLLMLTVWFGTEAGFFTAFITAAVLMVLGFFALKAKNKSDRPH